MEPLNTANVERAAPFHDLDRDDAPASLEGLVYRALTRRPDFQDTTLITEPNRGKYDPRAGRGGRNDDLDEVFRLMSELNAGALADPTLGADAEGRHGFVERLDATVDDLVQALDGRPITYVELGPEPNKTRRILARLLDAGVEVRGYVAVDINPASAETMRVRLSDLLSPGRVVVRNAAFEDVSPSDLHDPDTLTVLTSLGFQEGNSHPDEVAALLDRLMRPSDLVLSEMQVADPGDDRALHAFYAQPLMRRFSRLCVERSFPGVASEHHLAVERVDVGLETPVKVCATYEMLALNDARPESAFVTNYCLKPTSAQWRALREGDGRFRVLSQRRTGDRTVAFQLAERVPECGSADEREEDAPTR